MAICLFLFARSGPAAGLAPEETVKRLKPAEGLEVTLAASEPAVRQPVNVSFDERGRMWVVQYLQYPAPAGLKPVSVDQYLRTKYDRVPEPPPNGPRGADRITILEDADGDGRYERAKDFLSGLNLATSVEFGRGGVWVLQTPYLLFYPDKDHDDRPDGDPRVVLSGFGMEDAHAVANHLTWGPDGWLYGAQGSTCTADVRGQQFQQAAWRYNPATDEFEVFSEGGGNTFGLEWDAHGDLLTGTNYNDYVMVHYVQGGYFIKGFAKHGPLHNPFAFGYFDHVPHKGWRGGHVTQLGLIYQGGALPEQYNGKWIAPNLLASNVDVHSVTPAGSTFTTKLEGEFLGSDDKRFRPVDIRTGPDGAVYVADWYDARANHVIPEDTWDKTTGRVYRVGPKGLAGTRPFDLAAKSSDELVDLLSYPNDWYARTARRILADRRDAAVVPRLLKTVREGKERTALQALWALNACGGFNEAVAADLLNHPTADVRAWTVRLLGDAKAVSASTAARLAELARNEPQATVRAQLACSARRLPAEQALPVVASLMRRAEDVDDRYVPLLLWWALESKVPSALDRAVALFESKDAWAQPLARRHLVERLARRLTAEQSDAHFAACARLLQSAPGDAEAELVIAGMEKGLAGTALPEMPRALGASLAARWVTRTPSDALLRLSVRLGMPQVMKQAFEQAASPAAPVAQRVALIEALGQAKRPGTVEVLLGCAAPTQPTQVRAAAVSALQNFEDPAVATALLKLYPEMSPDLRARVQPLLASRKEWAAALLAAVESGTVKREEVPPEQLRRIALHKDAKLDAAVAKIWGSGRRDTPEEKKRTIERVRSVIAEGGGDAAAGKKVFTTLCAQCHAVRGEGGRVGPDLTSYDPKEVEFLVTSVVDPSAAIRPEFAAYVVQTTDGRLLNGPIVESGPEAVTVEEGLPPATTRITVARSQVKRLAESPVSRMPEGLIDNLPPGQVRDLFAYLGVKPQ